MKTFKTAIGETRKYLESLDINPFLIWRVETDPDNFFIFYTNDGQSVYIAENKTFCQGAMALDLDKIDNKEIVDGSFRSHFSDWEEQYIYFALGFHESSVNESLIRFKLEQEYREISRNPELSPDEIDKHKKRFVEELNLTQDAFKHPDILRTSKKKPIIKREFENEIYPFIVIEKYLVGYENKMYDERSVYFTPQLVARDDFELEWYQWNGTEYVSCSCPEVYQNTFGFLSSVPF